MANESKKQIAIVDNAWEITIPTGYIFSTDNSVIGRDHNIIIIRDQKGNSFDAAFWATESFSSMVVDCRDTMFANGISLAKFSEKTFRGNNYPTIVRDDNDFYISYFWTCSYEDDGKPITEYKMFVGFKEKASLIQVRFINSKLSYDEQVEFIDSIARSIKVKSR